MCYLWGRHLRISVFLKNIYFFSSDFLFYSIFYRSSFVFDVGFELQIYVSTPRNKFCKYSVGARS